MSTEQPAFPKPPARVRDQPHMLEAKQLPCCAPVPASYHRGDVEADHSARHGLGVKCSDADTIPLCRRCHRHKTDLTGPFRGWPPGVLRAWLDAQVSATLAALLARRAAAEREAAGG